MQASQPNNEVRLPRAVLRRSAEIEARFAESKTVQAADAALTADPAALIEPPALPPAVDPREGDPAYWKQRFKVTEGVLHKAREDHRSQVQDLRQQLSDLQEQVRTLQAGKTEPEALDLTAYFTSEQIEEYGEAQCRVMAEAAQKAARTQAQAIIEAEVKPLKERQASEQQDLAADRKAAFQDKLAALVPDYQEIDVSQGWLDWLAQEDPSSGFTRQSILDRHVSALDASRVGKLFKAYLASVKPADVPQPPIAPQGSGAIGAAGEVPQNSPTGGYPTQREIKDFYTRAKLNKVTPAERAEFEARMRQSPGA